MMKRKREKTIGIPYRYFFEKYLKIYVKRYLLIGKKKSSFSLFLEKERISYKKITQEKKECELPFDTIQ